MYVSSSKRQLVEMGWDPAVCCRYAYLVERHETVFSGVLALLARPVRRGAEIGEVPVDQSVRSTVRRKADHQLVLVCAQRDVVLHRPVL